MISDIKPYPSAEIFNNKHRRRSVGLTGRPSFCPKFIEESGYLYFLFHAVYISLDHLLTIATCTARKGLKGFCDCCSGFQVYLKACYFLVGIDCNIAYITVNKRSVDFLTVNVLFRRFQYGFDFCKLFFHLSLGC